MRTTTSIGLAMLIALVACSSNVDTVVVPGHGRSTGDGTATNTDGTDPSNPDAPSQSTDPETPPGPVVSGLSIAELAVFQGVKVDVMKGDEWITDRNAQVVAGRSGILRVYVTPDSGFGSKSVTAELRLVDGNTKYPIIRETKTIAKASTESDLNSTFNLELPAAALTRTTTFQVSLTSSDGSAPSGKTPARFPQDGTFQSLGAKTSGVVKVVVVPVKYMADGSGRTPDVTQAQLDLYKQTMMTLYPASDVEVTARQPYSFSTAISASGSGFSQILNAITQLRRQDGAADDVYYYGAFAPKSTFSSYCGGGCVTGLSAVADVSTPNLRASVGIGFTGEDSAETMAHEVGHAHGREHAPCGGASGPDPQFPYSGGGIGVPGYDIFNKTLVSTSKYHDMMGYCPPSWVSDYTYDALFQRIVDVVDGMGGSNATAGTPQAYRTGQVDENGNVTWTDTVTLARAPAGGQTRQISFFSGTGITLGTQTARFYPYDHLPGGVLIVPQSNAVSASARTTIKN